MKIEITDSGAFNKTPLFFHSKQKGEITLILYAVLIVLFIGLDQLTKYLASAYLAPVGTAPFLPGIMELRYVENDGMAFSMLSGKQTLLIVVTSITILVLLWYLFIHKPEMRLERIAVCMIIAGGIGNLIDRVTAGRVIDFFATTFINFAVFNVADCFVCVGGALWVLAVLLAERKKKREQAHENA